MNSEEINNIDIKDLNYLGCGNKPYMTLYNDIYHTFIYKKYKIEIYMFISRIDQTLKITYIKFYNKNNLEFEFYSDNIINDNYTSQTIYKLSQINKLENIFLNYIYPINNKYVLSENEILSLYNSYLRKIKIENILQ